MALTTDSFPLAFPADAGFDLRVEAQVSPDSDRIPVTVTVLTGSDDSKLGRIELSLYESLYSAVIGHESELLYSLWDSLSEADAIDDGRFDRSVLIIKRIALHPTSEPTLRAEVIKAAVDFLGLLGLWPKRAARRSSAPATCPAGVRGDSTTATSPDSGGPCDLGPDAATMEVASTCIGVQRRPNRAHSPGKDNLRDP